jgi:hypothetical protein
MMAYTQESFEAHLLAARDEAQLRLSDFAFGTVVDGESNEEVIEDLRAVWHAAEVALGILNRKYMPKREAIDDAEALIARWAEDED